MDAIKFSRLAVPAVVSLISFLSYSSQYLFQQLPPSPLTRFESITFNLLVGCIWICYARACLVDAGRVPKGWEPGGQQGADKVYALEQSRQRWCSKCEAHKPPRSHHCKVCQRSVSRLCLVKSTDLSDVFRKWTITVLGPSIASLISPFLISSASWSMQLARWGT